MTLDELGTLLSEYADGELALEPLQQRLTALLAAEPLGVAGADAQSWERGHHEARLFWRLVYLFDTAPDDTQSVRRSAARIVAALRDTASAETTFELLPLLLDEERFCTIVARHIDGTISRTGFLSVIAESGYPPHVKLWLEHAPSPALARLCARMQRGEYATAARAFEEAP